MSKSSNAKKSAIAKRTNKAKKGRFSNGKASFLSFFKPFGNDTKQFIDTVVPLF